LATGAAPVFGGALLAMAGGRGCARGLNFRGGIKNDLELLELLPEDSGRMARSVARQHYRSSRRPGGRRREAPAPAVGRLS
jgi:hypothetical protein